MRYSVLQYVRERDKRVAKLKLEFMASGSAARLTILKASLTKANVKDVSPRLSYMYGCVCV